VVVMARSSAGMFAPEVVYCMVSSDETNPQDIVA
jgi:hypothetical protein